VNPARLVTPADSSSIGSGPGAIGTGNTVTTAGGVVAFFGCEITPGTLGPHIVQASATGETPATSASFPTN